MKFRFVIYATWVLLGGCVSYSVVEPGTSEVGGLQLQPRHTWNQAPRSSTPGLRPESKVWTRDGILLDRIIIIPSVSPGESLFVFRSDDQKPPVYRAGMLPNEIEELAESSIVKLFGEGDVTVDTHNLRPHRFGEVGGFLFDLELGLSDGPNYRGATGAFVSEDHLYVILYLGAVPYYYEKHLDEAMEIIKSAMLVRA